jgi:hypothetical protein
VPMPDKSIWILFLILSIVLILNSEKRLLPLL